jgi:hypothetical protein
MHDDLLGGLDWESWWIRQVSNLQCQGRPLYRRVRLPVSHLIQSRSIAQGGREQDANLRWTRAPSPYKGDAFDRWAIPAMIMAPTARLERVDSRMTNRAPLPV